jgi:ADP-ribose pyrophosphatase YjhB (NUDIX family)
MPNVGAKHLSSFPSTSFTILDKCFAPTHANKEDLASLNLIDFLRTRIVSFFPRTPFGLRMIGLLCRGGYRALQIYWFVARPPMVGVQCLISFERDVLLIRNTYGPQLWTVPGGGIKPGEAPEEAVRREVYEEVGISLDHVKPLGTFQGRQDYRYDTVHVFAAQVLNQACTIDPGEILEARWFAMDALPRIADYARNVLSLWHQHGG